MQLIKQNALAHKRETVEGREIKGRGREEGESENEAGDKSVDMPKHENIFVCSSAQASPREDDDDDEDKDSHTHTHVHRVCGAHTHTYTDTH